MKKILLLGLTAVLLAFVLTPVSAIPVYHCKELKFNKVQKIEKSVSVEIEKNEVLASMREYVSPPSVDGNFNTLNSFIVCTPEIIPSYHLNSIRYSEQKKNICEHQHIKDLKMLRDKTNIPDIVIS